MTGGFNFDAEMIPPNPLDKDASLLQEQGGYKRFNELYDHVAG